MNGGCALETDIFWGNNNVQETLLKYRFEEHQRPPSSINAKH
jgi:hypothetical protein